MPVLIILLLLVMQEGEIVPDPVRVIYGSLIVKGRVHLYTFGCAYSYVLFHYKDTVNFDVLGDAAVVSD